MSRPSRTLADRRRLHETTGRADPAYTGEPMATAASAVPGGSVDLALEGCTVIVTGAGSGIGAATARLLGAAAHRWCWSAGGRPRSGRAPTRSGRPAAAPSRYGR